MKAHRTQIIKAVLCAAVLLNLFNVNLASTEQATVSPSKPANL